MSTEANDYNDNSILNATSRSRTPNGMVVFSIMLPSGRKLTSDGVREEDSAKAAVQWCEAVRGQIEYDMAEEKAARKRKASAFDTAPTSGEPVAETQPTVTKTAVHGQEDEISDPDAMIRRTIERLDQSIETNGALLERAQEAIGSATVKRKKWAAIAEGLGIELESNDDDSDSAEANSEADGDGSPGGNPEPVRTGGGRKRRTRRSRSKNRDAGNSAGDDNDSGSGDDVG